MAVISISNQKGGVGKTTTAVNLSAGLARHGKKILLVDLDPQCSATQSVYRRLAEDERGVNEAMLEETPLSEIIINTSVENFDLAPAGESLANADLNLASLMGRERYLENTLSHPDLKVYDHILIDTGPYLGLLTINAFVASDYLIVPVSCEYLPLLGLKFLMETVGKVKAKIQPNLTILGYLLTMYDKREKITFEVENTLVEKYGDLLFDTRIRINTKHRRAPSAQETIFEHERSASGKGTQDYTALTEEVLARLGEGHEHGQQDG
ncbi:MAG: ParA family protein [Deltaproteobacteria bacterium]|nr:ParA family protein [Deltaproteobacteria bacterium]MCB9478750.1 ParA family protein [Deltaproteobacteria bacterium]MCB9488266.1 ParA family protein [Deltaproteobacteria bacterium]